MSSVHNRATIGVAAILAGGIACGLLLRQRRKNRGLLNGPSDVEGQWGEHSQELRPPFPPQIVALLDSASLCYLSTALENAPHLSLMNFTYHRPTEQIIFTTRRNTRKTLNLVENPQVAILLHDFPHLRSEGGNDGSTFAITLYGKAVVLEDDTKLSKALRARHLEHNPNQAVFINGEGIAVVAVNVECARVCDSQDKVSNWTTGKGWDGNVEPVSPVVQKNSEPQPGNGE